MKPNPTPADFVLELERMMEEKPMPRMRHVLADEFAILVDRGLLGVMRNPLVANTLAKMLPAKRGEHISWYTSALSSVLEKVERPKLAYNDLIQALEQSALWNEEPVQYLIRTLREYRLKAEASQPPVSMKYGMPQ